MRALNVNTIDEVPDSSWFTNRIGRRPMSARRARARARSPSRRLARRLGRSGGKSTGVQPGFRMTDPAGQMYQIEFDPPSNPEMATGAEIIGTAFYYAFGYHTVEVYLTEFDPAKIVIAAEGARFSTRSSASGAPLTKPRSRQRLRAVRAAAERQVPRARQPVRRRASRSATSATTARGPTTRTTSCRTSIAASCAARACSARGSITTTRAA